MGRKELVWAKAGACLVRFAAQDSRYASELSSTVCKHRPQFARHFAGPSAGSTSSGERPRRLKPWLSLARLLIKENAGKGLPHLPMILGFAASGCLGAGVLVVFAGESKPQAQAIASDSKVAKAGTGKKRVVVLGTGWGGMSFLKNLDSTLYDVSIVAPRNYFVFTPLLPSVTSGSVEARSIIEPVRRIVRSKGKQVQFHEAECIKIDAANKTVVCRDVSQMGPSDKKEFALQYDYLVVAVGATTNTFDTKGVLEYCHFLKEVYDAEKIKKSILTCFESASLPHVKEEVRCVFDGICKKNRKHYIKPSNSDPYTKKKKTLITVARRQP